MWSLSRPRVGGSEGDFAVQEAVGHGHRLAVLRRLRDVMPESEPLRPLEPGDRLLDHRRVVVREQSDVNSISP